KGTTLFSDEFYNHFIYKKQGTTWVPGDGPVSMASHVEDVNQDPILIFDGLTKSHRYPGWRIGWVLGPPQLVETMARTASAIDGGPSRVAQRAALQALEPARVDQETKALREVFCDKRNLMVERLKAMGVRFEAEPASTFYCWGSLADLKPPFNDAMSFFWHALERQVMTVPGQYFDVNPGKRRRGKSPYEQLMRFSFGPPKDNVELGLGRLEAMLQEGA
ncbi:MAG: aspartate/methionine/tyrosine aminotransferase, partial [Planctomycetota bacterium]